MSSSPPETNAVSAPQEVKANGPGHESAVASQVSSDFKLWNPPQGDSVHSQDLPDSYFEPTTAELKASYQAQVRAREALVNAPLKTQELRDREAGSKLSKWPTTTIRIKFPDRTQLEKSFPSTDKIRSVYAFVRDSLRDDFKQNKFVLYQTPPRRDLKVSDPNVRDLSLFKLQLAPSSVLHLRFLEDSLNGMLYVTLRAPLLESILAQARDLPAPPNFDESIPPDSDEGKSWRNKLTSKNGGEKRLPKWFKIGQKR